MKTASSRLFSPWIARTVSETANIAQHEGSSKCELVMQIPVLPRFYPLKDIGRVIAGSNRFGEFGRARLDSTPMGSEDKRCVGGSPANLVINPNGFPCGKMVEALVFVVTHRGRLAKFASW